MSKTLKTVIASTSNGSRWPVMDLVRHRPQIAAEISKLIPARIPVRFDNHGEMKISDPGQQQMVETSFNTARNIQDAETVMEILPETELAALFLASCIVSPKDMITVELTYGLPENMLPTDVSAAVLRPITQYFESSYNIKPLLSKILMHCLLKTGSYPIAVLAENAIDEVVNNTRHVKFEHLHAGRSAEFDRNGALVSKGMLGNPVKREKRSSTSAISLEEQNTRDYEPRLSLEEFKTHDLHTTVIDNPSLLKVPLINQRIREQRILEGLGSVALETATDPEALSKLTDAETYNLLYKSARREHRPIDSIQTQERLNRRTIGAPLVMHLPSESVIPVFVPGNVSQQVGFFVLIDQDGNPLTHQNENDVYQQLGGRMSSGGSFASAMLNKVQANMNGFNCSNRQHLDLGAKLYGEMVEQDLLGRLRSGLYTNGVQIANKPEVYRIMLARALAAQHTQLLFMPIEIVTYFALRYGKNGIGRSVLDEMKILSSLRAMLTFANTMAAVRNSIGRTDVEITLDEKDPDPHKTAERYMHEIARTRQQAFPIGVTSPVDLTDYMQRAGFQFSFTGHPRMPNTSIQFTERQSNYPKVDTELEEDLRKRSIQKFGIPAQLVDAGYEAEFATSIATSNIMVSKNVIQIQDTFEPQLVDHMRKVAINDGNLIKEVREELERHYPKLVKFIKSDEELSKRYLSYGLTLGQVVKEPDGQANAAVDSFNTPAIKEIIIRETLYQVIMNFFVSLPRPNSVSLKNQKEAFDEYMEIVGTALDHYLSSDFINSDSAGDISEHVDTVKNAFRSYYARKWMAENGMLPELGELVGTDDDGKPLVPIATISAEHTANMMRTLNAFMENMTKIKDAANTVEGARKDDDTTSGGASPTTTEPPSSSSEGTDTGSEGDDLDFDLPDMGDGSDDSTGTEQSTETQEDTGQDQAQTPEAGG